MTPTRFLVDYRLDGRRLSFAVDAVDHADALRHVDAVRRTGIVVGELVATLDANVVTLPFAAAIAHATAWLRNCMARR